MEKLEFYSEMGCEEFFVYDYRRRKLGLFSREGASGLARVAPGEGGVFESRVLGMTLGLDGEGRLWVRRPDGRLMETQREIVLRAEAESQQAEAESQRAEAEAARASKLAAKLREMGVDPDSL